MLILNSVTKLLKKSVVDKLTAAVYITVALGAIFLKNISPVAFVVLAGLVGITVRVWLHGRGEAAR